MSFLKSLFRPAPAKKPSTSAERRIEARCDVSIPTTLKCDETDYDCFVADLSPSGAMVNVDAPIRSGQTVILLLPRIGTVPARVVHAGKGFYGLQFTHPEDYRDKIQAWIERHAS